MTPRYEPGAIVVEVQLRAIAENSNGASSGPSDSTMRCNVDAPIARYSEGFIPEITPYKSSENEQ